MTSARAMRLLGLLLAVVLLAGCGGGGGGGSALGGGSASSPLGSVFGGSGGPGGSGDPTGTNGSTSPLVTLRTPVPVKFQAGQLVPNAAAGKFKVSAQSSFGPIAADFNDDGLPDLLVNGTVQLQLPDHTFTAPVGIGDVPTDTGGPGGWPVFFFVQDVTGDGRPDVISAAFYYTTVLDPAVCVFVSNGDGTFQPRIGVSNTGAPIDVAFGDIDADGRVDMVICSTGTVSWRRGNGDGTFGPNLQVGPGYSLAQSVVCDDFNGDGRADIFVVESEMDLGNRPAHVCLSNGDDTFTVIDTSPLDSESFEVVSGDFDGDGKRDVAVSATASSGKPGTHAAIWVLLGNGDGTFQTPRQIFPSKRSFHLVTGDVNGDGFDDISFSFSELGTANMLLSNGDGTFSVGRAYSGSRPPYFSTLHDMDGDGRLDLVVPDDGGSSILQGNGDGTFDGRRSYFCDGNADMMAVGDVNGDGFPDVAVSNTDNNTVALFINRRDGAFESPVTLGFPSGVGACAIFDLSGDGKADLVVAESNGVSILRGTASGVGSPTHYDADTAGAVACAVADLDHDGNSDVVVGRSLAPEMVVFHGNGDGTLGAVSGFAVTDTIAGMMSADMNEDGYTDVVATCTTKIHVITGMADGPALSGNIPRFPGIGQLTLLETNPHQFQGPGDLHLDIAYGGGVRIYCGDGQGGLLGFYDSTDPTSTDCAAVADLDLDGLPDLITGTVLRDGNVLQVFRGTGTARLNPPPMAYPLLAGLRQVAAADMNGDGLPDVIALQDDTFGHCPVTVMIRKP